MREGDRWRFYAVQIELFPVLYFTVRTAVHVLVVVHLTKVMKLATLPALVLEGGVELTGQWHNQIILHEIGQLLLLLIPVLVGMLPGRGGGVVATIAREEVALDGWPVELWHAGLFLNVA